MRGQGRGHQLGAEGGGGRAAHLPGLHGVMLSQDTVAVVIVVVIVSCVSHTHSIWLLHVGAMVLQGYPGEGLLVGSAPAGGPGRRLTAAGRPGGRLTAAGRPGGRLTAAGRPGGRLTAAGRPGGRLTAAGRPGGRLTAAGRPGGRLTAAGRPGGRLTAVGRPGGRLAQTTMEGVGVTFYPGVNRLHPLPL